MDADIHQATSNTSTVGSQGPSPGHIVAPVGPYRELGAGSKQNKLVAAGASGGLAYTVGHEHVSCSMDGVPLAPFILRVTHLYRRENGEWKVVHRHADAPDRSAPSRRRIYRAGITAG
jgi:hypothetical protein